MDNRNKPILKIVLTLLIVVIIAGIWYVKNSSPPEPGADLPSEEGNADFALHVTDELDLEQLKSYGLPILLDFGADSCEPCRLMAPVLEELNRDLRGKVIIKFLDVWKYPELAQGYPVKLIPTQVFIDKDGNPFTPSESLNIPLTIYNLKETGEHVFTIHEGGMTAEMLLAVFEEMGMEDD